MSSISAPFSGSSSTVQQNISTYEDYAVRQLNQLLRRACEAKETEKIFLDGCGRRFDGKTEESIIRAVQSYREKVFDGPKSTKQYKSQYFKKFGTGSIEMDYVAYVCQSQLKLADLSNFHEVTVNSALVPSGEELELFMPGEMYLNALDDYTNSQYGLGGGDQSGDDQSEPSENVDPVVVGALSPTIKAGFSVDSYIVGEVCGLCSEGKVQQKLLQLEKDLTAYFLKARSAHILLNAESSDSYNVEWFVMERLALAVLVFPKDESQLISSTLATLVGILPLVAQAAAASKLFVFNCGR
jgi:hypothetical protein